jgi:hypothetical protein
MPKILTWENGKKVIREMTEEEMVSPPPTEGMIRSQRDELLSASDFRMVPDAPWDTTAWATYRQALRDITTQEGFPANVVWPTEPE